MTLEKCKKKLTIQYTIQSHLRLIFFLFRPTTVSLPKIVVSKELEADKT